MTGSGGHLPRKRLNVTCLSKVSHDLFCAKQNLQLIQAPRASFHWRIHSVQLMKHPGSPSADISDMFVLEILLDHSFTDTLRCNIRELSMLSILPMVHIPN
jgi:hypothetical protein